MRRSIIALSLLASACATRPETETQPAPVAPRPGGQRLIGLTAPQLIGVFGSPALQVHEGSSLKLQFRGTSCVLDAYLYPQGGVPKVSFVDARLPSGADTDQAACISALARAS
jgi:hypothetical protein